MKAVICPLVSSPASVAPLTLSPTYHMNCRLHRRNYTGLEAGMIYVAIQIAL